MPYMCRLCHPVLTSLQLLHNICQLQSCNWIDAWLPCCETIEAQIETGEAYPATNVSSCEITETKTAHCCIFAKIISAPIIKKKKVLNDSINSDSLTHRFTLGRLQSLGTVKMFAAKQLFGWFHRYTGSLVTDESIRIRYEDWDDDWKSSKSTSEDRERPLGDYYVIAGTTL